MKRFDVFVLIPSAVDLSTYRPEPELQESLTFVRGLGKTEYSLGVHGLLDTAESVRRHHLTQTESPIFTMDGTILSIGTNPTFREISALLRLGCEVIGEESQCCTEADDLRKQAAALQASKPTLLDDLQAEVKSRVPSGKPVVLFVCRHNSCRSQMAEAFMRVCAGDRFNVFSCGMESHPVHPLAVKVMGEIGIDIDRQHSKTCDALIGHISVDYAVFVCDVKEAQCPGKGPWPP